MMRLLFAVVATGLFVVTPAVAQAPGGGGPGGPMPVTVVTVAPQDVTLTTELPGRVVAYAIAEVRPQVDGIIRDRLFEEGAEVDMNAPLYLIDEATYRAEVAAAEAQVASEQARLTAAEREEARLRQLLDRNVVSVTDYDTSLAERDAAAAALEVARAQLNRAQIDLDRTTIRAPLSGVIGRTLTTRGALVTSGQEAPLAVIRDIDPVLVDVTQSAAEIIAWRRGLGTKGLEEADQTVELLLADGSTYEATGELTAAEPYVDEATGVVTLRMEFPNPDKLLLPGMYVQVVMPQGVAEGAILVPQEGVQRDRRGRPTAWVVNGEGLVEERVLTVRQALGTDWVVSAGLSAGDRVIVEGIQKVRPGAPAIPQERGTVPPAGGAPMAGGPAPAATPAADSGGETAAEALAPATEEGRSLASAEPARGAEGAGVGAPGPDAGATRAEASEDGPEGAASAAATPEDRRPAQPGGSSLGAALAAEVAGPEEAEPAEPAEAAPAPVQAQEHPRRRSQGR